MPGARCNVAVCNNSYKSTKGQGIMFHRFPKEPMIRKSWITKCRRGGTWNPDSCTVCSIHFTEEDYIRDFKSELLGTPGIKRLKRTAVPSQNLGLEIVPKSSSCSQRIEKPQQIIIKREILDAVETDNVDQEYAGKRTPSIEPDSEYKPQQIIIKTEILENLDIAETASVDQECADERTPSIELDSEYKPQQIIIKTEILDIAETANVDQECTDEKTSSITSDSKYKPQETIIKTEILENSNVDEIDNVDQERGDERTPSIESDSEYNLLKKKYEAVLEENYKQKIAIEKLVKADQANKIKIKLLKRQVLYHTKKKGVEQH